MRIFIGQVVLSVVTKIWRVLREDGSKNSCKEKKLKYTKEGLILPYLLSSKDNHIILHGLETSTFIPVTTYNVITVPTTVVNRTIYPTVLSPYECGIDLLLGSLK